MIEIFFDLLNANLIKFFSNSLSDFIWLEIEKETIFSLENFKCMKACTYTATLKQF